MLILCIRLRHLEISIHVSSPRLSILSSEIGHYRRIQPAAAFRIRAVLFEECSFLFYSNFKYNRSRAQLLSAYKRETQELGRLIPK